jgi:hypothetical protein
MSPFIRIVFMLFCLSLIVANSLAGTGTVKPLQRRPAAFRASVRGLDSLLSAAPVSSGDRASLPASGARICSCQILDLSSANYDHRHVALFAEGAGSSTGFSAARKRINREKKQLRRMFYNKVELVEEHTATGSCRALYARLKSRDRKLRVYEVLDVR